jgi:hypothetical protein
MQQRTRRLAIFFGGTLLATIGVLAACSTDNGSTPLPTQKTVDGSNKTDAKGTDNTDNTDNTGGSDAGADCSAAAYLHNNQPQGFFCAHLDRDPSAEDAGGLSNCANDETCCNSGQDPSKNFPKTFCAKTPLNEKGEKTAGQTACNAQAQDNGSSWYSNFATTWECGDKNNCGDGQVCCIYTFLDAGANDKVNIGKVYDPNHKLNIPDSCNALQVFKQGGTRCAASCDADEIQLCSKADDSCTGNQKCTPFYAAGRDLAACR